MKELELTDSAVWLGHAPTASKVTEPGFESRIAFPTCMHSFLGLPFLHLQEFFSLEKLLIE